MNSRQLVVILVGAVVSICGAFWLLATWVHAQEPEKDPWKAGGPPKVLDKAARAVSSDNEASVESLPAEVFNYPHAYGRMPPAIEAVLKAKLSQAELQHLLGCLWR
jgi:hypothetical protein